VNFTVTEKGLEDQLLALVVRKERPDLAELGEQLVEQQNGFKIKMKELEDNILFKLATAQGDITEDVELIEGLEEAKRVAMDLEAKAALARTTQHDIRRTSEKYRPVAARASLLFFLMNDLPKVHTYYTYSLSAFVDVFYRGIDAVSLRLPATAAADTAPLPSSAAPEGELEREASQSSDGGLDPSQALSDAVEMDGDMASAPNGEEGGDMEEGKKGAMERRELTDEELAQRCVVLVEAITRTVFQYLCRGLFERDKLTVAAVLALRVLVSEGRLSTEEVDFLVGTKAVADPGNMGPVQEWLPSALWPRVKALEGLKRFHHLGDAMQSESEEWRKWFDHEQPEAARLPGDHDRLLTPFDRLILLRALRPDRLTTALREWVGRVLGADFVFQRPFDMGATFAESSPARPIFFVLFPGVDPTSWVEALGRSLGVAVAEQGTFVNISMGQGQERLAEAVVERFAKQGGWIMLQNCHLMQSWLPRLERLLEVVNEGDGAHPAFRCFISAEPPPLPAMKNMPESLMQGAIKVANEAPADLRSNMVRAWSHFSQERIDGSAVPDAFKACLFALCWFHSLVLGRRRFGPQGWSRAYSFNTGDLTICANVLQAYLETAAASSTTAGGPVAVPWEDLRYIFGEIMYGGHITDAWDRRTCNAYLQVLLEPGLFQGMELGPRFRSPAPERTTYDGYLQHILKELPPEAPPQFGLHPNAEIGYLTNAAASLLSTIQAVSVSASAAGPPSAAAAAAAGGGAGAASSSPAPSGTSAALKQIMTDLLERLPGDFNMPAIQEKARPLLTGRQGPFVVVALQECARMNALLGEIRRSLQELDKGLKGQLNMSQAMEDLARALLTNEWPGRSPFSQCAWEKLAWPSKKRWDAA
jgi:dynein heavy chain, axonemal